MTGSYPNPSLAPAGTAGTYTKVTTDSKGRVTSGTTLSASDVPTVAGGGSGALSATDASVTNARTPSAHASTHGQNGADALTTIPSAVTGTTQNAGDNSTKIATTAYVDALQLGGLFFNVKAYGVKGDGTTDDTVAIQAAINAAGAVGGQVYFPAGTFICNTVTAASGIQPSYCLLAYNFTGLTITGSGKGTILKTASANVTDFLRVDSCYGVTIKDLQIQAAGTSVVINGLHVTTQPGTSSHYNKVDNVEVSNQNWGSSVAYDVSTTAGSSVITSAQANWLSAGDIVGINQDCGPLIATVASVATQTATLNGAVDAVTRTFTLNARIPNDPSTLYYAIIDSEIVQVVGGYGTTSLTVHRSVMNTSAAAHSNGATIKIYQATLNTSWAQNPTTTLNGTITASGNPTLNAVLSLPQQVGYIKVDSEIMAITANGNSLTPTVTRGALGTTAVSHASGATVTICTIPTNGTANYPEQMYRLASTKAVLINGIAVGVDHPGASNMDLAQVNLYNCAAAHCLGAGFAIGNGVSGNILDNHAVGCNSTQNTIGVWMNGGAFSWHGGGTSTNGVSFKRYVVVSQGVYVAGVRDEEAGVLWEHMGAVTSGGGVTFSGVVSVSYTHLTLPTNREV